MNSHTLQVLEYQAVLDLPASYACSEAAREQIKQLRPACDPAERDRMRSLFSAFITLRREGVSLPAARFDLPEAVLVRAAPERSVLDPEGFAVIRNLLIVVAEVRTHLLREPARHFPQLQELAAQLNPCRELLNAMDRTFEGDCYHLRSTAGERLRKIRTRMLTLQKKIQDQLERMLHDPAYADVFQEDFIALRHGRYVLTVKREARAQVRGIVHDQSNSGMTLYIEPESVIEAGNELECLRLDERDEVRRILGRLTARIREQLPEIRHNFEILCRYDMAYAVSAWAVEHECVIPNLGGSLRLVAARHPLLERKLALENRKAELVPLDLSVPSGKNVVVITGSNTGGKTVALKTIGVLTLMALAGLPVPAAADTTIPLFANVHADIGDEQSIEQSLSTFSAHLEHIVETLAAARTSFSLVLLDELGAGTDPVEGGALASAILNLLSATDSLTFATTHLGTVKRFVHAHPRMTNASMLFDLDTLRPLYRLVMGHAGASYALAIAARRGVPTEVIETARSLIAAGDLQLESMLAAMDQKQIRLDRELGEIERLREETLRNQKKVRKERERLQAELKELRRERRELLRRAQKEAEALVASVQREMKEILSQMRRNLADRELRDLRKKLEEKGEMLRQVLAETESELEEPECQEPFAVGDVVWVNSLREQGKVLGFGDRKDRVTVEVRGLRVEVERRGLSPVQRTASSASEGSPSVRVEAARGEVPSEINLVGQRVEEALGNLDRFLNAALIAGLPEVRIIHGHGMGTLRRAVHEYLQRVNIRSFRLGEPGCDPGGTGVTIVAL
ncbi:MAG: endonuclease MutS2 [Kiritimatiellia bacterium]